MAKTFVIIDESKVNSFGFRTMIDGVDLKQYKKNPILLWMHQRAFRGTKDEVLPLGSIVNIRVEGEERGKRKLLGDALFDEKDSFAKQIGQKVEDGFLRMASAGLDPLEWSDAIELKLPGQSRLTLTKSKLFEVSIVDIGSDDGALALWKDGNMITLAAGGENKDIPIYNDNHNKKDMETKAIALKLGLPETATEQEILDKISICLDFQAANVTMKSELDSIKLSAITGAVDAAIASKRINADKKEHFINLGKAVGVQQLNETLALIPESRKPTDVLNLSRGGQAQVPGTVSADVKKLSELSAEDIITLRRDNKEEYARLYKAEYNSAPRFEE